MRYAMGMLGLLRWLLLALVAASCAHVRPTPSALPARPHPLEPLSADEDLRAFAAVRAHFARDPALPTADLCHPLVALAEPPKADMLTWRDGQPYPRQADVHILHAASARAWVARVDLQRNELVSLRALASGVQPALAGCEYAAAGKLVRAHEPWQKALAARGLDPARAYIDMWAPGRAALPPDVPLSHGAKTRLLHVLTFYRGRDTGRPSNPYVRPVEGLVVTLDLNAMKVVHLSDTGARAINTDDGNAAHTVSLRPLQSAQPEGSDIMREGYRVRWHAFQFVIGFSPRDGLVLYDVRYDDHGVLRPIAYRMSLSEIYVPYGLGDPNWQWRSAFDVGEYNAGMSAQPLERGSDVPAYADLVDLHVAADGVVHPRPRAIGLYERDAGVLWTRTDPITDARETRRGRELVITWSAWLSNYIYNFDWVFKLDGSIEVVTHLQGTTLNRGTTAAPEASAPKIAKDAQGVYTAAPHHQHFVNFRLDLDVDGTDNGVMEMDVVPLGDATFKNAFDTTMLHLEQEGARDAAPLRARHWHVESGHARNAFDKPTSFSLEPGALAVPYSAPDFAGLERAGFANHQLWFTRYRDGELYAAGEFPYQAAESDGVATYVAPPEPLTPNDDLVLWYTTGFTHVSRPEDYPVMPSEAISFRLLPRGFFAHNPSLELAPP